MIAAVAGSGTGVALMVMLSIRLEPEVGNEVVPVPY